jgi:hypothetical protein
MTEVAKGAAICVRTSPPRSQEQVDRIQPVVVLYELTNLRIAKTLARLGLPGQDSICRYGFIEVMRSLPTTKGYEEHPISCPIRDADDARDAPGPALGLKRRIWREDVMDFLRGVHPPKLECSHSISSRPLSDPSRRSTAVSRFAPQGSTAWRADASAGVQVAGADGSIMAATSRMVARSTSGSSAH